MPARATSAPRRPVSVDTADTAVRHGPAGVVYLQSRHRLGPFPGRLTERLEHWAERAPRRTFLAQRDPAGRWRSLTYAEALATVRRLAQALLQRRLSADRPILILSGNGIEHALLGLAALYTGVPYAPIAPAYSLQARDHATLKQVVAQIDPTLVFAAEGAAYDAALRAAVPAGVELVVSTSAPRGRPATLFAEMACTRATSAVDDAHARVGP